MRPTPDRHAWRFAAPLMIAISAMLAPCLAQTAQPGTQAALPFEDRADYEDAARGLVAPFKEEIRDANGQLVWSMREYDFLSPAQVPATVNPSLWRMAQLNTNAGLFKVAERIYQVRGLDLSNMTVIEGDQGLIVIDPLLTTETARAALALFRQHRPARPVIAVIYSHSHADHFGGVRGIVDEADVRAGKVKVYAPSGFMQEAVSENVFAGIAMFRRAQYQAGSMVTRGERGVVDTGIGKTGTGAGTVSLIAPTDLISRSFDRLLIDGVEFEFQLTPGTEAPAEMNMYLPRWRALCMAENATHTLHNLLTPRGAQVRDSKMWGRYLDEALVHYGDRVDVMFAQHHWPTWGGERIRTLLADQRDLYTWLNDRALHLINKGYTPAEIGQAMQTLPGSLEHKWYARGYYGSASFNARAVYQRYLGFYDGNPAHLDPLVPVEQARRYVIALGGPAKVLDLVRDATARGDLQWAVELGNHLVFAEPASKEARGAQADALEQLAFRTENSLWRNMYLSAVVDLRGTQRPPPRRNTSDLVTAMDPAMYFDFLGVRIDSQKAQGHDMKLNWIFDDLRQRFALTLRNGVLTYREDALHADPDVTVTMGKPTLDRINLRQLDLGTALRDGEVRTGGNAARFRELMGFVGSFNPAFSIVTPDARP